MLEVKLRHGFASGFKIDAEFEAAGTTVLFGPSGCGKSTILAAVAGLLRPQAGRILLDGEAWLSGKEWLPPHRRRAGLVFQEARLFPHLSVAGNLRYGAARAHRSANGPTQSDVLDLLGIGHLLARRPAQLSGGERQRVALARALLSRPRILLMDEPLAALDAPRRWEAMNLIEDIRTRFGLPILYVTHALDEVDRLAERLVLMGPGNVLAAGTPEELALRPDLPLALRRDAGVLLHSRVLGHDAARGITRLGLAEGEIEVPRRPEAVGHLLRLRLRARDVAVCTIEGPLPLGHAALPVRVLRVDSPHPAEAMVTLGAGGLRLLARLPRGEAALLSEGQPVRALIPSTAFDHHGSA
jgi:molybdate transport system ATP-binding protein